MITCASIISSHEKRQLFTLLGISAIMHLKNNCPNCNSLGCPFSGVHRPVGRWNCYQKKYENH